MGAASCKEQKDATKEAKQIANWLKKEFRWQEMLPNGLFLASDQVSVINFAEDLMCSEVWEKLLATYLLRYARLLQMMTRITAAMIVLIMGTPSSFGSPTILKWKKPTITATRTQTMSCVKVTVIPFLLKKKHATPLLQQVLPPRQSLQLSLQSQRGPA